MPRHQLRPDRAAGRHPRLGRSVPGRALLGVRKVLRPPHGGSQFLSAYGSAAMTEQRFTAGPAHHPLADGDLHPRDAVHRCGDGFRRSCRTTWRSSPSTSRWGSRSSSLRCCGWRCVSGRDRRRLPPDLPAPMKLAAHLSHYALYAAMIAMPLLGWGMLSAAPYPVVLFGSVHLPPILPQSESLQCAAVDRASPDRVRVLRAHPGAYRSRAVPRAGAA